ncbi:unnamed protein product [Brassica rapa]|uniref:Uncharacterized protein n=1 Tax=Brassica campestris TaxID=3711 RepID=A0A8D9HJN4_BRACM|nr:unnamed protein product [Brassica rapa]
MFGKILGFSTPLFICRKKISMYACVTKVIPEADVNDPSKISGCILLCMLIWFEKFQLEINKMTAYETCIMVYKMFILVIIVYKLFVRNYI